MAAGTVAVSATEKRVLVALPCPGADSWERGEATLAEGWGGNEDVVD